MKHPLLVLAQETYGSPLFSVSSRPADAVYVGLTAAREIIIHYEIDLIEINPPGRNIGCDQIAESASPESLHCF